MQLFKRKVYDPEILEFRNNIANFKYRNVYIKIVERPEESSLWIKGITKAIENKAKEQKCRSLPIFNRWTNWWLKLP